MGQSKKRRTKKEILEDIKTFKELGEMNNKILNALNEELEFVKFQKYWLYTDEKDELERRSQNDYRTITEKYYYLPPENIMFLMEYFKTYVDRVFFLHDLLEKYYPKYLKNEIKSIIQNEEYERMFFLKRFQ